MLILISFLFLLGLNVKRWINETGTRSGCTIIDDEASADHGFLFKSPRSLERCETGQLVLDGIFLLALEFLETEELLSVSLIELTDDEGDGVFETGDDDVLDGVDATVGDAEGRVQGQEGGLEGGQDDEILQGLLPGLARIADLLPSLGEAGELLDGSGVDEGLEVGQMDTGDVLLLEAGSVGGMRGRFDHRSRKVSRGVLGRCQGERRPLELRTEVALLVSQLPRDATELEGQRIRLFLQQIVSRGSSLQPGLDRCQVHPGGEDWESVGGHDRANNKFNQNTHSHTKRSLNQKK